MRIISIMLTSYINFSVFCQCSENSILSNMYQIFNAREVVLKCIVDFISETNNHTNHILILSKNAFRNEYIIDLVNSFYHKGTYRLTICTVENRTCDIPDLTKNFVAYTVLTDSEDTIREVFAANNSLINSIRARIYVIVGPQHNSSNILKIADEKYLHDAVVAQFIPINETLLLWRSKPNCGTGLKDQEIFKFDCKRKQFVGSLTRFINCLPRNRPPLKVGVRVKFPFMAEYIEGGIKSKFYGKFEYVGIENAFLYEVLSEDISNVKFIKGNFSELLEKLKNREIDNMIGGLPAIHDVDFIGASYPYLFDKLIAIVKRRTPNKVYLNNAFATLSSEMWISLLIFGLILTVSLYVYKWRTEPTQPELSSIVLVLFGLLLGKTQPSQKNSTSRLLSSGWIWCSFFLRCAVEIFIIISMVNGTQVTQITSLDELCVGTRKVFTTNDYRPYLEQGIRLAKCYIPKENVYFLDDPFSALNESTFSDVSAMMMFQREYKLLVTTRLDDFAKLPFAIIPEAVLYAPIAYYFHRDRRDPFDYAHNYTRRVRSITSSGLLLYYERESRKFVDSVYRRLYGTKVLPQKKTPFIKIEHMLIIFVEWFRGILLAVFVFFIEIFTAKFTSQ